jgi:TIR domain
VARNRDIFISYAEEDGPVATGIALALRELGFLTWTFEEDGIGGVSYLLQVNQAIEGCKTFVLLGSHTSTRSHQVIREVEQAHERQKLIIPVRLGITHQQFVGASPILRMAIGTSVSIFTDGTDLTKIAARIQATTQFSTDNGDTGTTIPEAVPARESESLDADTSRLRTSVESAASIERALEEPRRIPPAEKRHPKTGEPNEPDTGPRRASPNATSASIDEGDVVGPAGTGASSAGHIGQSSRNKSANLALTLMAVGTVVAVILGLASWMQSPADNPAAVEQTQSASATEGGVPNEATRAPATVRTGAPEGTSSDGTSMPAAAAVAPSSPKTPSRGTATENLFGGGVLQPKEFGKLPAGNSATLGASTPTPSLQAQGPALVERDEFVAKGPSLGAHWRRTLIVSDSPRDDHLVLRNDGTAQRWSVTATGRSPTTQGRWNNTALTLTVFVDDGGETSAPFTFYEGQLVWPNIPNQRTFWDRLD